MPFPATLEITLATLTFRITILLVSGVSDIEISIRIHSYAIRMSQRGVGGWPTIAGEPLVAVPRHGSDYSVEINLADAMVECVGDVKVSRTIRCHAVGSGQQGFGGFSTIAGESLPAVPGDRCDDAVAVNLAYAIVASVGDV
jgi:hypothetical protein